MWTIKEICLKETIDIVHVLWGSTTGFITVLFSLCPIIILFCGSDLLGSRDAYGNITLGENISRFFSKVASYVSAHNITKSEQMKTMLLQKAQLHTTVISNGVDLKVFYPMDTSKAK